jgi:DNA topoisomerase IA
MPRVYDFICRQFVASVSNNAVLDKMKTTILIGPQIFTCATQKLVRPGFLQMMPWLSSASTQNQHINFSKGQKVNVVNLSVQNAMVHFLLCFFMV